MQMIDSFRRNLKTGTFLKLFVVAGLFLATAQAAQANFGYRGHGHGYSQVAFSKSYHGHSGFRGGYVHSGYRKGVVFKAPVHAYKGPVAKKHVYAKPKHGVVKKGFVVKPHKGAVFGKRHSYIAPRHRGFVRKGFIRSRGFRRH
ncbi:MAG: hypothetical protein ACFB20_01965 [Opitutales bacterium]